MSGTFSGGRGWAAQQGTDEEYVARLGHDHPAVAEYAAYHFFRDPAPDEALEPLRKLVLTSPSADTRRAAADVLRRMGARAVPALPDLRKALADPPNGPIRSDLESAIGAIDNSRNAAERRAGD